MSKEKGNGSFADLTVEQIVKKYCCFGAQAAVTPGGRVRVRLADGVTRVMSPETARKKLVEFLC